MIDKDTLATRLKMVQERIAAACLRAGRSVESVRMIAVTKNHPLETLQALVDLGVKDLGENRVPEIVEKVPGLKGEFTMHMIGHLQTNKAQKVLPLVSWIQSVDRERLVSRLESLHQGEQKVKVLVEVNTTGEESKNGCSPKQCRALCERVMTSDALELRGLMTIGPLGGDEHAVRKSFALLRSLSESCSDLVQNMELSMGMSGDFEWAIEEGATMVRIGTTLVGARILQ